MVACHAAFAAIMLDGTVVTWGASECGGDSSCSAQQSTIGPPFKHAAVLFQETTRCQKHRALGDCLLLWHNVGFICPCQLYKVNSPSLVHTHIVA